MGNRSRNGRPAEIIIGTLGNDTDEWQEAQTQYGQLKEDLERLFCLSIGFECIRGDYIIGGDDIGTLNSQDSKKKRV